MRDVRLLLLDLSLLLRRTGPRYAISCHGRTLADNDPGTAGSGVFSLVTRFWPPSPGAQAKRGV